MAETRQVTDLDLVSNVQDNDTMGVIRQGGIDFRYLASQMRAPLLRKTNNLSDLDDVVAARSNLGLNLQNLLRTDEARTLEVGIATELQDLGQSGTATVIPSIAEGSIKRIEVTGDFTLDTPNDPDSGYIQIEVINDATGNHSITVSGYETISGSYNSAANVVNLFRITKIGSNSYLEIVQPE